MLGHKVALFCHNLEINGANKFILTLADSLKRKGRLVILAHRDGSMRQQFSEIGVNVEIIERGFDFQELKAYDAIFINSLMMSRIVLECVKASIPHVLIVHETWAPENIDYFISELWNVEGISSDDIRAALKGSQHVVFPAKYLGDVYDSLVEKDRRSTIYCTIEMDKIEAYRAMYTKKDARENLGIASDKIVFLQVGTVTRRKAQMATLEAFSLIRRQLESSVDVSLIFVGARSFRAGEKKYVNEIQDMIVDEGLEECVEIHGVQDDIYKYFLAADVLVHPSINEVLPLAILEGCYCGLPVIVSNLDGMPEVIRHKQEGLLVNPYDIQTIVDAMLELACNESLRYEYGGNARRAVAAQHAPPKFSEDYSELLGKLIAV
jgi:glycosyltransferase involved in cell wall biosynthesis